MPPLKKRDPNNAPWSRPKPELIRAARDIMEGKALPGEMALVYDPLELMGALDWMLRLEQAFTNKRDVMQKMADKAKTQGDPNAARVWNEMVEGRKPLVQVNTGVQLNLGETMKGWKEAGVIDADPGTAHGESPE